ncbi:MAG: hypothetical protein JRH11_17575 [Deltaproteobacteria bacterium]|nr:hypothetical protein [Deltaproteobacteria bacterium]
MKNTIFKAHLGSGLAWAIASVLVAAAVPSTASAQYFDDRSAGLVDDIESDETWALEFRVGTYQPAIGDSFEKFFAEDTGPLLAFEIDFLPLELHDWFDAGITFGFGWSQYVGLATTGETNGTSTEETSLTLYPMPVLAVIRVDALSRRLNVPLLVTGKLGAEFTIWNSGTGSVSDATNMSIGLHWGVQFALELDIFNQRAARALDEVWGINHSFLFFELFGSAAHSNLNVAPKDGVAWAAGLGFLF